MNDSADFANQFLPHITPLSDELLQTLGFGVVIIDADDHKILYANSKLCNMSGHLLENIIGRECRNFLCPADRGACPIRDLGQTVDNSERVLICADGAALPIVKTVVPLNIGGRSTEKVETARVS